MSFERVRHSRSQTSQTSWNTSQFAPRPFPVQEPKRPPTPEELENPAFQQDKFETTGLQLKEEQGTITPVEQERLGILQAKMDSFWAQRMERAKAQPNLLEILIRNAQASPTPEPITPVQPKLAIGEPNDQYEQEADQVAEQVMKMPAPPEDSQPQPLQNSVQGKPVTPSTQHPPGFAHLDLFSHAPQRCPLTNPFQAKLTIGQPNDVYEQEADRVAEQVMRMAPPTPPNVQRQPEDEQSKGIQPKSWAEIITPIVQRLEETTEESPLQPKCETCEQEEQVQRSADGMVQAQPDLESRLNASKSGGSPLPDEVRSFMEPRFKTDFSQVQVHTDSEAVQMNQELGAQAFTHRNHIYYGAGKSPGKDELTGHELTHVVQQTSGENTIQRDTRRYRATDPDFRSQVVGDESHMGDATFERLAHGIAYQPNNEATRHLIEAMGFIFSDFIEDSTTGLSFYCLTPNEDMVARGHLPVLVFTGSEPPELFGQPDGNLDWYSDLRDYEPGTSQFNPAVPRIHRAIQRMGGLVDVTGHSLGGALAQITAAYFPDNVRRVVTFQAPGIGQDLADRVTDHNREVRSTGQGIEIESTHYRAAHDIVDDAGEVHTEGNTFELNFDRRRSLLGDGGGIPSETGRVGVAHSSTQLPGLSELSEEELSQIEITQGTTEGESLSTRPIEQLRRLLSGSSALERGQSMDEALDQWIQQYPEMLNSPHFTRYHRALIVEILFGLSDGGTPAATATGIEEYLQQIRTNARNLRHATAIIQTAPEADRAILMQNYGLLFLLHGESLDHAVTINFEANRGRGLLPTGISQEGTFILRDLRRGTLGDALSRGIPLNIDLSFGSSSAAINVRNSVITVSNAVQSASTLINYCQRQYNVSLNIAEGASDIATIAAHIIWARELQTVRISDIPEID